MRNNKVGPFVFKHKETGLYLGHENENDVENLDYAQHYKITTYAYFFVGKRILEYKETSLHEEKLKISRIRKLQNL